MLWFLIVPILWVWLIVEAWTQTDRWALPTWPHGIFGWCAAFFALAFIAIIGGIVAGGIAGVIGSVINDASIWHLEDRSTRELVSVRDKDGAEGKISGGLFLFAGYFESRPYYFYYTKDASGAMHPDRTSASEDIFIHEIDSSDAKLIKRQWDNGRPWLDLFAFTSGKWQYHFFVPKGTVRRDFTM